MEVQNEVLLTNVGILMSLICLSSPLWPTVHFLIIQFKKVESKMKLKSLPKKFVLLEPKAEKSLDLTQYFELFEVHRF